MAGQKAGKGNRALHAALDRHAAGGTTKPKTRPNRDRPAAAALTQQAGCPRVDGRTHAAGTEPPRGANPGAAVGPVALTGSRAC